MSWNCGHLPLLSSPLRLENWACLDICEMKTLLDKHSVQRWLPYGHQHKHSVQKVKGLSFLSTPLCPYTQCIQCAINLTPTEMYAKLSVSHQYLRQMDSTYAVIPENHMNKTFHISCRMPWLRNDESLYWSPMLIPYGRRVMKPRIQQLSRACLVRSVHSGLWSKQKSAAWLRKSFSGEQKCYATGDVSNRLCFQSSRWPFIRWFTWSPVSPTYCFPHLVHVIR